MTARTAYQFLEAPLSGMTREEKEELCRLIKGEPEEPKQKVKDPVPSVEWYKKQLLKGFFKSKEY